MNHSFVFLMHCQSAIGLIEGIIDDVLISVACGMISVWQAFFVFLEQRAIVVLPLKEVLHF
jgi:hypothetical protein